MEVHFKHGFERSLAIFPPSGCCKALGIFKSSVPTSLQLGMSGIDKSPPPENFKVRAGSYKNTISEVF